LLFAVEDNPVASTAATPACRLRRPIMAIDNKTNSQNPANKPTPPIIDKKADLRPDLGVSVGGSRGTTDEPIHPTGTIPETRRIDPNNTDAVNSWMESGTSDTVPGKRLAAGLDDDQ
jgi:hypothetical protein